MWVTLLSFSFLLNQAQCKDLDTNLDLLKALLYTKEAVVAKGNVVNGLTLRVEILEEENHHLRGRVDSEKALCGEKALWKHLRRNP